MIENQNGLLKFSGNISQASVIEAYEKYYREFYFDGGLIKGDKELANRDELRKEITSGRINEAILNKTFEGINDKVPKVEKAILTYEIKEVNTLDEIPMPQ